MPISTFSWQSAPTNIGTTEFRKWGKGVSDALAAVGMVNTADTGQIDWATVAVPVGNGTVAGYEIWRFNDALQATKPIFFKVTYQNGYAGYPALTLEVRTGSDGAGTLTGNVLCASQYFGYASSSAQRTATEYTSYASGDGSAFAIVMWIGADLNYGIGGFSIERSCGTDGTYNGDAIAVINHSHGASSWNIKVTAYNGTDPTSNCAEYSQLAMLPYRINNTQQSSQANAIGSTLSKDGTTAPVLPLPLACPGAASWVSNQHVIVHPGDAGATSVIQVAVVNGVVRTYRAFPVLYSAANPPGALSFLNGGSASSKKFHPAIAWAV